MKTNYSLFRITVLVLIGTAVAVFIIAACTSPPHKTVDVTAQTIGTQQAGRPYLINLTQGAVYDVSAGVNYGRVEVRTSNGDIPLENFTRQRGFSGGKRLLLGSSLVDLVDFIPPNAGGFAEATCDKQSKTCNCTGRKDCSDLSQSGKCKSGPSDAICGDGFGGGKGWGCTCARKS